MNINKLKPIFIVTAILGILIGVDYYHYTQLPLRKIHIEYSIYSLSGKHDYVKDLEMKGDDIYIFHSGTTTSPYEAIGRDGCFLPWGNFSYRLRSGVNQELEVHKFYYK